MRVNKTVNYQVTVENAVGDKSRFILNTVPTVAAIVAVLEVETIGAGETEAQRSRRYDHLIGLTQYVDDLKIPLSGWSEPTVVNIAGVDIGSISIRATDAWTVE